MIRGDVYGEINFRWNFLDLTLFSMPLKKEKKEKKKRIEIMSTLWWLGLGIESIGSKPPPCMHACSWPNN
jgi:hypothetical protein